MTLNQIEQIITHTPTNYPVVVASFRPELNEKVVEIATALGHKAMVFDANTYKNGESWEGFGLINPELIEKFYAMFGKNIERADLVSVVTLR
jgi:hypothetical protein